MSTAKMHADELDIDVDLVKRLIAEQFPDWAELPVVGVEPRGTDNALYRLGDNLVIRLPRRERTAATLEKERRWVPKLEPLLPLRVPTPIADGVPALGYPWSWAVYRWIPGKDATNSPFADPRRAAELLAEFLAALHALDPAGGLPPERTISSGASHSRTAMRPSARRSRHFVSSMSNGPRPRGSPRWRLRPGLVRPCGFTVT